MAVMREPAPIQVLSRAEEQSVLIGEPGRQDRIVEGSRKGLFRAMSETLPKRTGRLDPAEWRARTSWQLQIA